MGADRALGRLVAAFKQIDIEFLRQREVQQSERDSGGDTEPYLVADNVSVETWNAFAELDQLPHGLRLRQLTTKCLSCKQLLAVLMKLLQMRSMDKYVMRFVTMQLQPERQTFAPKTRRRIKQIAAIDQEKQSVALWFLQHSSTETGGQSWWRFCKAKVGAVWTQNLNSIAIALALST